MRLHTGAYVRHVPAADEVGRWRAHETLSDGSRGAQGRDAVAAGGACFGGPVTGTEVGGVITGQTITLGGATAEPRPAERPTVESTPARETTRKGN